MKSTVRVAWVALIAGIVAVPLVVGALPFGPQLMLNPFSSPSIAVLGLSVAIAVIAWVIALARGEAAVRWHGLLVPAALLVALLAVSSTLSLDRLYSLFGDGDDLNGLAVYLLCALLTFLVIQLTTGRKAVRQLTTATIVAGTIVAAIALLQQLFVVDIFGEVPAEQGAMLAWMISQGASTLGNPDFTGTFLVAPAVLALSRAFMPAEDLRSRLVAFAPAVVTSAALVLTLTRGAWLGLGAGIAVLVALVITRSGFTRELKRAALIFSVALVAVAAFAWPEIVRRVGELASSGTTGVTGRTLIWSETLRMIARRPVFGTGPAAFRLGWYQAREVAGLIVGSGAVATDAHNFPLMLAAIGGIPAALVALFLWIATLITSAKAAWAKKTPFGDYCGWWAAAAGLSVALLTGVATTPVLVLVFLALGVLLAPLARPATGNAPTVKGVGYALAALGVCAAIVTLLQANLHLSARTALTQSPAALSAVAQRFPWAGQLGVLAAQFASDELTQTTNDPLQLESNLDKVFAPLAERHPADYEPLQWWSTQLFVGGDVLKSAPLLQAGIGRSDAALRIYPVSLPVRTNRARAFFELGQPDRARKELDGFVNADPSFTQAADVWELIESAATSAPPAQ